MPIDSHIRDGSNGNTASVDGYGSVQVSNAPPSLPGWVNRFTAYNALMGSAGAVETGKATTNMGVNGATNNQKFYIAAEPLVDIRIMKLVVIVADSAVTHNSFGNVAALTNGFNLKVFERGIWTNIVSEAKTGGQLIAQSGFEGAYGSGATSFELTNWSGSADAQSIIFDIASTIPGGIRIAAGSEDRIEATVRDNLTGLEEMTVRVIGYRHHA